MRNRNTLKAPYTPITVTRHTIYDSRFLALGVYRIISVNRRSDDHRLLPVSLRGIQFNCRICVRLRGNRHRAIIITLSSQSEDCHRTRGERELCGIYLFLVLGFRKFMEAA